MAENKQEQQVVDKQYIISGSQVQSILRYLFTRPYGEVVKLMNSLSALTPYNTGGGKDDGKK